MIINYIALFLDYFTEQMPSQIIFSCHFCIVQRFFFVDLKNLF